MRSVVALAVLVALPAAASTWEIDPNHTESSFVVKHLMVSNVRGQFGKTTGTVQQDDKDITKSKVDITIDATTVDTSSAPAASNRVVGAAAAAFASITAEPMLDRSVAADDRNSGAAAKYDIAALPPGSPTPVGELDEHQ